MSPRIAEHGSFALLADAQPAEQLGSIAVTRKMHDEDQLRDRLRHSMGYEVLFFIALLSTALALGGAMAHALELPNKINLSQDEYFVVQKAYRGWNQLAYLLAVQFISMVSLVILSWSEPNVRWPIVLAILCLLLAQAVFWTFTFPANVATESWTSIPDNWEVLRNRWEYSHATGAAFQVLAMSFLILAVLARART